MKTIKILLIAFILSIGTVNAQSKTTFTNLSDSSKVTFSEVYKDVKEGIDGLASSLKVGAEHVYLILIKQQLVDSITLLIVLIIGLLMLVNTYKNSKSDEIWDDSCGLTKIGGLRIIQLITGIVLFLVGLICINDIITGFINPEYGAIKEIITFIK